MMEAGLRFVTASEVRPLSRPCGGGGSKIGREGKEVRSAGNTGGLESVKKTHQVARVGMGPPQSVVAERRPPNTEPAP